VTRHFLYRSQGKNTASSLQDLEPLREFIANVNAEAAQVLQSLVLAPYVHEWGKHWQGMNPEKCVV